MEEVVAPLLHTKAFPPEAVRVTLFPTQTAAGALIPAVMLVPTVTVATAIAEQSRAFCKPMPGGAGLLIQRLLVVVTMATLGWLAITVGISGIARAGNPELALWWSPRDARALSNLADRILMEKQNPATLVRAVALSKTAIRADPTDVVAIRILGLAQPETKQAPYFAYANKLSKRDLFTQLWLIENEVSKGNARGALVHYDAALRTSEYAPAILFPILSSATADAELAPEIAKALAKKPDWAIPFLYEAVNSAPSPDRLVSIFETVKKSGTVLPAQLTGVLTARTLRDYRFDLLRRAYFVGGGRDAAIGHNVTNGDFGREPQNLPFDWAFTGDEKIFAGRIASDTDANQFRMIVQASDGVAGEAVRQLLLLKPGQHRLSAQAGNIPSLADARIIWRVTCADKQETPIGDILVNASGNIATNFAVPSKACDAQWLMLRLSSQTDRDDIDAWFDNVRITPLRSNEGSPVT